MGGKRRAFIITVMGRDRLGVIADVTRGVLALEGHIHELSQTVLQGFFTVIFDADFPASVAAEEIQQAIARQGKPEEFCIGVQEKPLDLRWALPPSFGRFILTAQGPSHPDLIYRIASYLSDKGINIEDFYAQPQGEQTALILQVYIPDIWDIQQLQLELEELGGEIGVRFHLQHENIFRVTSEIAAVRRLALWRGK